MMQVALPRLPLAVWRGAERLPPPVAWERTWLAFAQAADVPPDDDWLSPAERALAAALASERRRADWRLGRWAAKQALADRLELGVGELARLAVLPAADGAPEAHLDGGWLDLCVSLSHRAGAAVAVASPPPLDVGCDLERNEPRSAAFVSDYFTSAECLQHAATPALLQSLFANLVWSAKESALKLLRVGLSVDTRSVEVRAPSLAAPPPAGNWQPLEVTVVSTGERFQGFWMDLEGWIITLVVHGPRASGSPLAPKE